MSVPTAGLAADVLAVLEAHGHHCPDDQAHGAALILLGDLLDAYEGRINSARQARTDGAEEVDQ